MLPTQHLERFNSLLYAVGLGYTGSVNFTLISFFLGSDLDAHTTYQACTLDVALAGVACRHYLAVPIHGVGVGEAIGAFPGRLDICGEGL